jgi:hypothetical protein
MKIPMDHVVTYCPRLPFECYYSLCHRFTDQTHGSLFHRVSGWGQLNQLLIFVLPHLCAQGHGWTSLPGMNTVCQFTKQHGVKLDTLVKHSSPQLESMLFSGYTSSYNCIHSECWLMQVLCSKYLYIRSMWGILSPAGSHVRINRHYLGLALCEDEWSLSHSAHCTPHHCGITHCNAWHNATAKNNTQTAHSKGHNQYNRESLEL